MVLEVVFPVPPFVVFLVVEHCDAQQSQFFVGVGGFGVGGFGVGGFGVGGYKKGRKREKRNSEESQKLER